jgi:uncharacterized protein YkwD
MRFLKSLKVLAFVALAFGILIAAEASQAYAESWLADDEAQMLSLVNSHRATHGFAALAENDALRMIARRQAQRMVEAGYIYHNPNLAQEANDAVPGWVLLGENVGVGPSTDAVEQAFLNSPHHHENIDTQAFNLLGVGAMASDDGSKYYTQDFAEVKAGSAPASAPAAARPAPPIVRVPRAVPVAARPRPQPPAVAAVTAAPTPVPTPVPTLAPTPVPTLAPTPVPAVAAPQQQPINVGTGLLAMLKRFFAKLGFWR